MYQHYFKRLVFFITIFFIFTQPIISFTTTYSFEIENTEDINAEQLFYNSYSVFHSLRNDIGVYADAIRFTPPQFHPASVATVGMGLISLCIADTMEWIEDAEELVIQTLEAMNGTYKSFQPERNLVGTYRHFINLNTGVREWNSEFSTIDTAILTSGALFCKNYFNMNDKIAALTDSIYNSISWDKFIANPETGKIYMTIDSLGNGLTTTDPFNEYMIVAWLALHDATNNKRAKQLWNSYYANPTHLTKSTFEEIDVLTDYPGNFLSGFVSQFCHYLCHYFTSDSLYQYYFKNTASADQKYWDTILEQKKYIWGFGAGASPFRYGYFADNIQEHPGTICSPHIISGFIPVDTTYVYNLIQIWNDSLGIYLLPNQDSTKILWRFSIDDPNWYAEDIQGVDYSTMLFGLATYFLGDNFFYANNNFNFPKSSEVNVINNDQLEKSFQLIYAYPNPFNSSTNITWYQPVRDYVSLYIYDINGKEIKCLYKGIQDVGQHLVTLHNYNLASGIYYCLINTYNKNGYPLSNTHKILLLK